MNRKFETHGRGGTAMVLPQGADYSLTESALISFQAAPAQSEARRHKRSAYLFRKLFATGVPTSQFLRMLYV